MQTAKKERPIHQLANQNNSSLLPTTISYAETKNQIINKRNKLAIRYLQANQNERKQIENGIKNYWVASISNTLYNYGVGTRWDFNGTTRTPQQGTIACGYFVTTLLLDMGLKINRIKLSTCAASEMMQQLVPHQKIKNLNGLTYSLFCDSLKNLSKGVYVIGLDYHVGFIVNDGLNCWFIHSNYINRQGVIKELVQHSTALKASNTRWLINLTADKDFITRWLTSIT